MSSEAYIYEAIRTPRGKNKGGALHGTKPVDLVVGLIEELKVRHPNLDPAAIDDVVLGVVSPVGEQGAVIARTAALNAGLPETVAGVQLNRFCASGLEATNTAAQKVRSGWDHLIIAGGVESMSRVPMGSDGGALFMDPATAYDNYIVPQGIGADLIATRRGLHPRGRRRLGRALAGQGRGGLVRRLLRQVRRAGQGHQRRHRPRPRRAPPSRLHRRGPRQAQARLRHASARWAASTPSRCRSTTRSSASTTCTPAATPPASSTAPRWCSIGNEQVGKTFGLTPRARIVATASIGSEPTIMLTGPTPATEKVLKTAGLTPDDIDLWELNEAFASVVLKWIKDLHLPEEKVNVNGGAIAMGHPLGATGAMLVGTVVDELERRQARRAPGDPVHRRRHGRRHHHRAGVRTSNG